MKKKVHQVDDQTAVNYALFNMGIKWSSKGTEAYTYTQGTTASSVSVQVVLLPNSVISRHCKNDMMKTCYAWHPLVPKTGKDKKTQMIADNTWKLRNNWNITLYNTLTGNKWLKLVTK